MAINDTLVIYPDLTYREVNGHKIEFSFTLGKISTGDASGGGVKQTASLGSLSTKFYYCITDAFFFTDASSACSLSLTAEDWENFAKFGNPTTRLVEMASSQYSRDYNIPMLYLGKPANSSGDVYAYYNTNTDTKTYDTTIFGFAFKHPLPLDQVRRTRIF